MKHRKDGVAVIGFKVQRPGQRQGPTHRPDPASRWEVDA